MPRSHRESASGGRGPNHLERREARGSRGLNAPVWSDEAAGSALAAIDALRGAAAASRSEMLRAVMIGTDFT